MDKREQLEETCEKLREAHEATATKPEWGKVEQKLILRLMRQVKARRVVIIALSTIMLCGIALLAYWRLYYPSHLLEGRVSWDVGDTEVEVEYLLKNEDANWKVKYYFHDKFSEPNKFRAMTLTRLNDVSHGSHYVFTVFDDNHREYYIVTGEDLPKNRARWDKDFPKSMGYRPINDASAITARMLEVKVWPVPLLRLKPLIKQLHERKYIAIFPGSCIGAASASEIHVGSEVVRTMRFTGDADLSAMGSISLWPSRFSAAVASSGNFVLSGNAVGYTAYQPPFDWGSKVDVQIVRIKKALQLGSAYLPLSESPISPALESSIQNAKTALLDKAPDSLQSASQSKLLQMYRPWYWDAPEPELIYRDGGLKSPYYKITPCTIGGVSISEPMRGKMELERGEYSLLVQYFQAGFGTPVQIRKNDKVLLTFYVRDTKPYPQLKTKESADTEKLLADAADIASAVFAQPDSAWPEGKVPDPNLKTWLKAIAGKQLVLEAEAHTVRINSNIYWEGDKASLAIWFGETNKPDIEMSFEPDKFTLHLVSSNVLLTSENGKAELMQAPGGRREVLSAREMARLQACIDALDALQAYEPIRVSPDANVLPEGKLAQSVPSSVISGIDELRRFLAKPVLPDTKQVSELPKIEWGFEDSKKR